MYFIEIILCMRIHPPKFSLGLLIPFLLDKNIFLWFHHYGNAVSVKQQLNKINFFFNYYMQLTGSRQKELSQSIVFYNMTLL